MATGKTILVLGGGIGGIVAANRLRNKLPREHRVVLIERESDYVFAPSFLWLMTGLRTQKKISRPLRKITKKGVELVQGDIDEIDPARKRVSVKGKDLTGDYLIVALGAALAPEAIPGLEKAGHNLYTLAGAKSIRDHRLNINQGRIAVLVSAIPFKCPAAPYEAAMLLGYDCRKRKIRDDIQIDLYTPEPGPMPLAGPENSKLLRQMVESKGIRVHTERTVKSVNPETREILFREGDSASFDLLVFVPPHVAPRVIRDAGMTGETGWVPVDRNTMETKYQGVFAVGDVTGIMLKMGKPLPKAGVFAHGEADVVADNLVHAIKGVGRPITFDGHGECFIETGDGKAGYGSGNFYAEPTPQIKLKQPSRTLHLGKVAFEKYWLFEWF